MTEQSAVSETEWREALRAVRKIISHENCADGIAAALLLHIALPDAEVQFAQYKEPSLEQLPAEPGLLFCDISPPRERIQEFLDVGSIVLDHHKGAEEVVRQFRFHAFADEATRPGVSGATLAYREVLARVAPHEQAYVLEDFAEFAGIRDTWQTKHHNWEAASAISAAVKFYGYTGLLSMFPSVNTPGILHQSLLRLKTFGELLLQKNLASASAVLKEGFKHVTDHGTRVVIFNAMSPTSDAAEVDDGKEFDLVVGFKTKVSKDNELSLKVTMRSHTTFNCKDFALYMRGGGHTKSAGFSLPLKHANPYALFLTSLVQFEYTQAMLEKAPEKIP